MIQKKLEQINERDLQSLIDNGVLESKTLEYKGTLTLGTKDEKKEFLADVSAFANASGGDLIFGIAENKNKVPSDLIGFKVDNIDKMVSTLENIIRDGIQPRLPLINIKTVQLSNRNVVLILRIGQSWTSPHRVTYSGYDKFFSRSSNGKYPLDVNELRVAFNLSETIIDRIRKFRIERISKIVANETPIPLNDEIGKMTLHIVPIGAFSTSNLLDFKKITRLSHDRCEPIYGRSYDYRINFDGYLTHSTVRGITHAYTQFYRNGIIEAVNTSVIDAILNGSKCIPSEYEVELIKVLKRYMEYLKDLNVTPPFFVFLTLTNIKGYIIGTNAIVLPLINNNNPIDRNILTTPEVMVEDYNSKASDILKPIFDSIWNACGFYQSLNYDENGNFKNKYL